MQAGRRLILVWVALLASALTLLAPTPARAHPGHEHHPSIQKAVTDVAFKDMSSERVILHRSQSTATEKVPFKQGALPPCDGMCCLGFGLTCCVSAMAVEAFGLEPPPSRRLVPRRPLDRYGHSADILALRKPPKSFV
jgi:hypothetical protein